jgi:hypothetical protein
MVDNTILPPHLQRLVEAGVEGVDIMHGEIKNLMHMAEKEFEAISKEEAESDYSDAMLSMDRTRAEGILDTLAELYALTYQLSFAIGARNEA